jgi:hypothetical protein
MNILKCKWCEKELLYSQLNYCDDSCGTFFRAKRWRKLKGERELNELRSKYMGLDVNNSSPAAIIEARKLLTPVQTFD